jgi:hypothetical protein
MKIKCGTAMVNVKALIILAMEFANTQDKNVAKNALTCLKIKSGNATVNVNPIISLAMECAPVLEMCHIFKKVTSNVLKMKDVF